MDKLSLSLLALTIFAAHKHFMISPGGNIEISVVATIYRAEGIIDNLVSSIITEVSPITQNFEIILVEDCSPDNSWNKILENGEKDNRVKGLRLSRNFGQQIAMSAGMKHAQGAVTVIMDGDLQNPPEAIPHIIKIITEQEVDILYTTSNVRNNWRNEVTSKLFWYLMNRVFKLSIIPNQLMMKGFNRKSLDLYNSYPEHLRVVAGITQDIGMKTYTLPVDNKPRTVGKSNYNFLKRFHLMVDIVLAMTEKPLNFLITLSLISLLLCFAIGFYTFYVYLRYPEVPAGYTTLVILITFFSSSILLVLGVIGRYLSSIYLEVRQRPLFIINKKINI